MTNAIERQIDSIFDVVHGATSQALVCDDLGWQERLERIGRIKSTPRRLAILAAYNLARSVPQFTYDVLVDPYKSRGYEVLGVGRNATAIRIGDMAIKLIRSTERLTPDERFVIAMRLESEQSKLLNHLADYSLKQDFVVTQNPIRPGAIVAARQKVADEYRPLRICNSDGLSNLNLRQRQELGRFTDAAFDMIDDEGWAPDIIGVDNIGFTGPSQSLTLIDTVPIHVRTPQDNYVDYLERMTVAANRTSYHYSAPESQAS